MIQFISDTKNKQFMRLWWAQLISQFGDRIHQMALIGLIAQKAPGSAMGLAKLLAFTIVPVFLVGPFAGVYVDRWDRRRTLFFCDILRIPLVLLIPFVFMERGSMIPIYGVVFLVFCFSRFYVPAKMSIIPDLVPKENLLVANSLMTTTGMIAFVLGCALGGLLVDYLGPRNGFLVDAFTYLVSGLMIMSIRKDLRVQWDRTRIIEKGKEIVRMEKSVISEIREGIEYLIRQKELRFVINTLFILLAAGGAVYVVIIVFIQQTFQSVTKDLGVIAVVTGVGLFLGTILYGKWGKRFAWYQTIFICLICGGAMTVLFAYFVNYYANLYLAAGLALILGLVLGPIFIASNTIVHLVSDREMQGKVFTALEIVIHFAFLLAMLVSSYLSEIVDPVWILVGVGCVITAVGIIGFFYYKGGHGLANQGEKMA